ncbi:MAG TPA: hypothetical protein VFN23_17135 [Ktedonobacteraceae bacterium]|nr:hypothetical protein [Ktedonobacteraceae bacterium]
MDTTQEASLLSLAGGRPVPVKGLLRPVPLPIGSLEPANGGWNHE